MNRTWDTKLVAGLVVAALIVGVLAGRFLLSEWKPVGDGTSVVHTRTGEVRVTGGEKLIPMRFRGRWSGVKGTLELGAFSWREVRQNATYNYQCEVVQAEGSWIIVRLTEPGERVIYPERRLELVGDDSLLYGSISGNTAYGNTAYTRVTADDD